MIKNPSIHTSASKKESKTKALINELKTGEKSGMISNVNPDKFLDKIHQKYLKK